MTRPKGKVIYRSLDNPEIQKAVREAHKAVVAERVRLQTQRAERRERPVPNWKCYTMLFVVGKNIDANGNWLGGKLPRCKRCDGRLDPKENHVCEGFVPKYKELTQQDHENWETKREERRQARWEREDEEFDEAAWEQRTVECRRCGGEIYGIDDPHECPEDIDSDSSGEDQ